MPLVACFPRGLTRRANRGDLFSKAAPEAHAGRDSFGFSTHPDGSRWRHNCAERSSLLPLLEDSTDVVTPLWRWIVM